MKLKSSLRDVRSFALVLTRQGLFEISCLHFYAVSGVIITTACRIFVLKLIYILGRCLVSLFFYVGSVRVVTGCSFWRACRP